MLNQLFAASVLLIEISTRFDTVDFDRSAALVLHFRALRIASNAYCRGIPPQGRGRKSNASGGRMQINEAWGPGFRVRDRYLSIA